MLRGRVVAADRRALRPPAGHRRRAGRPCPRPSPDPSRVPSGQPFVEATQLLVAVLLDDDPAALAGAREPDLRPERPRAGPPRPARSPRPAARGRPGRARPCAGASRSRRASSSIWRTDSPRRSTGASSSACRRRIKPEQRPAVALGDPARRRWRLQRGRRELEEAERVRDRRPRPADPGRDLRPGVSPNSSTSWRYARASSTAFRSARWRFSTSASSSWSRPASLADDGRDARQAGELRGADPTLARDRAGSPRASR